MIPRSLFKLKSWYALTFKDKLLTPPYDLFLQSFVTCELFFQLPFFIYAVYILLLNKEENINQNLFKNCCLVYGSHTVTTLIPILASILFEKEDSNLDEKAILLGFYLPYLVFPLWLVIIVFQSEKVIYKTEKND